MTMLKMSGMRGSEESLEGVEECTQEAGDQAGHLEKARPAV